MIIKTYADFGINAPTGRTGNVSTQCPQCVNERRNKSAKPLSVNMEKEVWNCHHCGWAGSLKSGIDTRSNPSQWKKKEWVKPEWTSTETYEQAMLNYFASRGISEEVLRRNDIGFERVYMPQREEEVVVTSFPFKRKGEVVNIKYRDGMKNFRMVSGAQRIFFGLDDMIDERGIPETGIIIVEGEIDKLSFEMCGFRFVISVPDGAPSLTSQDYSNKFDFIENCAEELGKVSEFYIAVDNDKPGEKLEDELVRRLGRHKCSKVTWPSDCKDANDVLVKHGIEALQLCFYDAEKYPIEGVIEVNQLSKELEDLWTNGLTPGEDPGWKSLKPYYTVKPGEWTLVTGLPGSGKSEWIDALALNLATKADWGFAIYSPENLPVQLHVSKLIEKHSGVTMHSGAYRKIQKEEYEGALFWIDQHFSFINPEQGCVKLDAILDMAKELVLRKGINGLIIDPWNELDHERPPYLNESEYISKALSKLSYFARTYQIHIWIVAHPTKLAKGANGEYPVPTPYDVAGSANWRNKAYNCIAVHRNYSNQEVEIYVQKVKFKNVGKVGSCTLIYNYMNGRYTDPVETFE